MIPDVSFLVTKRRCLLLYIKLIYDCKGGSDARGSIMKMPPLPFKGHKFPKYITTRTQGNTVRNGVFFANDTRMVTCCWDDTIRLFEVVDETALVLPQLKIITLEVYLQQAGVEVVEGGSWSCDISADETTVAAATSSGYSV